MARILFKVLPAMLMMSNATELNWNRRGSESSVEVDEQVQCRMKRRLNRFEDGERGNDTEKLGLRVYDQECC